jgi:uncharacterized spore protein YtfJ
MADSIDRTDGAAGVDLDPLFEKLARKLGDSARAAAVFGEPVERQGLTVIPVARARWGVGGGGGGGRRHGGEGRGLGGGGGATVTPVGYIEIRSGGARFRPVIDLKVIAAFALGVLSLALFARRRHHHG